MEKNGKIPPNDVSAEQSIIGCCLLNELAVPEALNNIGQEDFFDGRNKTIFAEIEKLFARGEEVETVTLMNSLRASGKLGEIGGVSYLAELTGVPASIARVKTYCEIVKDKSRCRALLGLSREIEAGCYHGQSAIEIVDRFGGEILKVGVDENTGAVSVGDVAGKVATEVEERHKNGNSIVGVPTGLADLDRAIHGFLGSELIILAGRPSMGKTTLALNWMYHAAKLEYPCLFFSLEMSRREIVEKLYSLIGRIDHERITTGNLADGDWPKLTMAQGVLEKLPIYIDDQGALPITQLRARARLAKQRYGIKLVVVDYLQLLKARAENRTNEITEISGQLKALAKELDVPVIALSQLSRNCESRTDKRPMMSDLRESGAIEQDANMVMFVYRDEVYHPEEDNPRKGIAEVIISKMRRGQTGKRELVFLGALNRFENMAWLA